MAVRSGLLFCCPFHVKPELVYSDVKLDRCVLGSPHTENTWQTESALVSLGDAFGFTSQPMILVKRFHDSPRGSRISLQQGKSEMSLIQESRKGRET